MNFWDLIKEYNIPILENYSTENLEYSKRIANKMGYPVVVKIKSDDISHKSDCGGVALNIMNDKELTDTISDMLVNVARKFPEAHIEGVTIQKQAEEGLEMIVGIKKDPQFGHVIIFGLGGIYTEALNDVTFKVVPFNAHVAEQMIGEINAYKLLRGFRGQPKIDLNLIVDVIMKLQQIVKDHPEIEELDINPLICYKNKVIAIDGRCF